MVAVTLFLRIWEEPDSSTDVVSSRESDPFFDTRLIARLKNL